jgi:hypothetical protein
MTRERQRVGRKVTYFPTDAEAVAGGGTEGDQWPATISDNNNDGSANLHVVEADGGTIALTSIAQGQRKGEWDFRGLAGSV